MGVPDGAGAGARHQADPGQLRRRRLGTGRRGAGPEPGDAGGVLQAAGGRVLMGPAERLAELGLTLPPVAAPLAAYVPAVRDGDHVYVSGQLPLVDGELPVTGKVGAVVS